MSSATSSFRPWMDRWQRGWQASPLPAFLGWWGGELLALLPSRWRDWFRSGAEWHLLQLADGYWTVRRGGHAQLLARWADNDDVRVQQQALAIALQSVDREDLRLALLLPASSVLQRSLLLPLAARHNLRQVAAFEMDRQTPFTLAQVHYAVSDKHQPAVAGRFRADLVVVPRATLAPLLARSQALGISVDAVDVADGGDRLGVNLLPEELLPHRARPRLRLNLALAGICMLLLGLALGGWLHNREVALASMQAEVQNMSNEARQVAALRTRLQDNAAAAGFLAQRKRRTVAMLSVLREATARLPDSAWLERFSVDNTGQIGMQGQAVQAVKLLDMLKDSPLITHAGFQGSIQPDPSTGKERFYLTAKMPENPAAPSTARSAR